MKPLREFNRQFPLSELAEVARVLLESFLTPLPEGAIVGFSGELGSGKTTLIRELVHQLGGAEPVSSPTYTLEHIYPTSIGALHHWDLYRLGGAPMELFENTPLPRLTLVEWPEREELVMERLALLIKLEIPDPCHRRLSLFTQEDLV